MTQSDIVIRGAREHNLRDVDLRLPRNKLICMTGVSGSGKSSLAFDTLYAEGQRRYVESLSSYARQFLGQMPKPAVDSVSGLAPSISIQQKTSGRNPRSTVGTITEIYDYLRVLFARVGQGHCERCGRPISAQSTEQIIEDIAKRAENRADEWPGSQRSEAPSAALAEGAPSARPRPGSGSTRAGSLGVSSRGLLILAPLVQQQKGEYRDLFEDLLKQGFLRARVDGTLVRLSEDLRLDRQMKHTIELVVDRLVEGKTSRSRLTEAVETALRFSGGTLIVAAEHPDRSPAVSKSRAAGSDAAGQHPGFSSSRDASRRAHEAFDERLYSAHYACTACGIGYEPPGPQLFSFNSPLGMCLDCNGLGVRHDFVPERLIPNEKRSISQGAVELIGPLRQIGRWRRHIYRGVAGAIEKDLGLPADSMLKTPWRELPEEAKQLFLHGMGDRHITFAWRHAGGVWKHGGTWEGVIPELLAGYRKARNPMRRRQLEKYMETITCAACHGSRLNPQARNVRITSTSFAARSHGAQPVGFDVANKKPAGGAPRDGKGVSLNLPEVCSLSIGQAAAFFQALDLDDTGQLIAAEVLKEIRGRLGFLLRCGLDYLALDRTAPTLSGGESQRIRLAGQIGCGLVGVVYILDEPSIGLHPRDNRMLLESLCDLRDQGNTVIVVEHDEETMRAADHIVDFGPGPGIRGGEVVATGTLRQIRDEPRSVTGRYLAGERTIPVPERRRRAGKKRLKVVGARHNNLKEIDVPFPLGTFICVTGVSGSGKSSLVNDILWQALNREVNKGKGRPGRHKRINGLHHLDKAIDINQSPIGRTPRSNPATYVKLFDEIRRLFARLPESKVRGHKPGRFSFNVEGGRCEACQGHGANKLEMDFLADIWVTCPVCQGHRFNHETLQVRYKGASIAGVLEMDVQEALDHFRNIPKIAALLQTLHDVGLDYLKLGQPSPTLSGGEAQRIKLARELGKRSTGRTIYLLDEPTTGLHFADISKLLEVLHGFVGAGNTVVVVEHNLEVVKTADWIIDLGPEGGEGGGRIVAEGPPEEIARCPDSHTGRALAECLEGLGPEKGTRRGRERERAREGSRGHSPSPPRPLAPSTLDPRPSANTGNGRGTRNIVVRGAAQHNLQKIDVDIPRERISVFCGPSGSGKSSLAMDTLYAEGQRRYVESLSAYARQFLGQMPKPRFEHIHGLSPAIAIEQKTTGTTPRSTVGTVTEVYDYLRILYARLGQRHCPDCRIPVETQTTDDIIDRIVAMPKGTRLLLLAPQEVHVGQKYEQLWKRLEEQGFLRVRIDGRTYRLEDVPSMDRRRKHRVELVVDRVTVDRRSRSRIADSVEAALDLGRGVIHVAHCDNKSPEEEWQVDRFSLHFACQRCGRSFEELSPHNFSFNSPLGWCDSCEGLGTEQGTNLSALIADERATLADGAVAAWPSVAKNPLFRRMLESLAAEFGIPLDVPFNQLDPLHRRMILYGTGERWIPPKTQADASGVASDGKAVGLGFRFQYKGLYPAVEEASRVSYVHRQKLYELVGETDCSACDGSRLRDDAAAVRFRGKTLQQLCDLPLNRALAFLDSVKLKGTERRVAGDLLKEATGRLSFLVDVGLHYLTLARTLPSLSGGETQRIRLAGQLGRSLTGVLYVLDEPTIGLHPRDNGRLLEALRRLRDLGNTVVIVEHDREVLGAADRLYDFGPGAGRLGGTVVSNGTPKQLRRRKKSLTGQYLGGRRDIPVPTERRMPSPYLAPGEHTGGRRLPLKDDASQNDAESRGDAGPPCIHGPTHLAPGEHTGGRRRPLKDDAGHDGEPDASASGSARKTRRLAPTARPPGGGWLELIGARMHNLRDVDLRVPLGTLTCVTGVSGSGKSSLIEHTLARAVARKLHRSGEAPGPFDELHGVEHVNKVILVDQQPLGNTPASNPATYTGLFDQIRELFARLPEAKVRGYRPARFSFNRSGGRCEDCEGNGQKCIEMHFLPDVWVQCDTCRGKRYNRETLAVEYRGRSIADVLEMPIGEAHKLFQNIPRIRRYLATLCAIGLDYLTLGQPAPTLSGGEAQRVKLAAELARPHTGRTLYILDEPTTGLHFDDIDKLLTVLGSLVAAGNTVVVIEHNLDVIKTADWIVDLGPEAGDEGGWIVAEGTPENVAASRCSPAIPKSRAAESDVAPQHPGFFSSRGAVAVGAGGSHPTRPQPPRRSHTAEMLRPVLQSSRRAERDVFDASEAAEKREGDLDLSQVGRGAKMPWQIDGRRWHTKDRVSHNGQPCRWEGAALESVIDELDGTDGFGPADWNDRSVVEIAPKANGPRPVGSSWFLHALTGDEWLLTLKFRVSRNAFRQDDLRRRLKLKPVDDIDELPVYGRGKRVRVKNLKGPWQEVTVTVHWRSEIDTPEFRAFLNEARQSFLQQVNKRELNPADLTPWKVLGRKWHLSRKGFPSGRRVRWDAAVLDRLLGLLEETLNGAEFDYAGKSVVVVRRQVKVRASKVESPTSSARPSTTSGATLARVHTKRRGGVDLELHVGRGSVPLGRVAGLAKQREIRSGDGGDVVKLRFDNAEQLSDARLRELLQEIRESGNA